MAKESCTGCQIPVEKFDACVQRMIRERIDQVISLRERIAAGNLEDKLEKQIVRLRNQIQEIEKALTGSSFSSVSWSRLWRRAF